MDWKSINTHKVKIENKPINKRYLDLKLKYFIKKKFQHTNNKLVIKNNKYGSWVIK